jgi:hypothetical protein
MERREESCVSFCELSEARETFAVLCLGVLMFRKDFTERHGRAAGAKWLRMGHQLTPQRVRPKAPIQTHLVDSLP